MMWSSILRLRVLVSMLLYFSVLYGLSLFSAVHRREQFFLSYIIHKIEFPGTHLFLPELIHIASEQKDTR